jgi:HPt (histidine-containing phosphotransfer) domain-containing protein
VILADARRPGFALANQVYCRQSRRWRSKIGKNSLLNRRHLPTSRYCPPLDELHLPNNVSNPTVPLQRRFRSTDVIQHLDMAVIGDVCLGVSLAGYRDLLASFLTDNAGCQSELLAALDCADTAALTPLAHALHGAAASMGLIGVQALARRIEVDGASYSAADCRVDALALRDRLDMAAALLQRMGFA